MDPKVVIIIAYVTWGALILAGVVVGTICGISIGHYNARSLRVLPDRTVSCVCDGFAKDAAKLAQDWEAIGQDMRAALRRYERERLPPVLANLKDKARGQAN